MRKRKKQVLSPPLQSSIQRRNRFKQWLRWFKKLKTAIFDLALKRYIYKEITAIIEANPRIHVPSVFYDWMRQAYVTEMTIGIRKLVDWDKARFRL